MTGRVRRASAIPMFLFAALGPVAAAAAGEPLVQVSGPSPHSSCAADDPNLQFGQYYPDSEVEPFVAVNPADPLNVVAVWQQDRWSNGGARSNSVGVSLDGGLTWTNAVIPGLTRCSGGAYQRSSDPWISFSPDGTLHQIALALDSGASALHSMLASRSTDGGLTWSAPTALVTDGGSRFHDKESITADPYDADYVYAVWDMIDSALRRGPTMFTRTLDGGNRWEGVRPIFDPGASAQTLANQLVVLPGGVLIVFFTEIHDLPGGGTTFDLAFRKSGDRGVTWAPAVGSYHVAKMAPKGAVEPERSYPLRDGAQIFDVAVDRRSGALYAVWQDGDLAGGVPAIAFTTSKDGGATWTKPFRVNRTPPAAAPGNRQAFLPSVHVTDGGVIGVSYYDFRNNGGEPESLADHWLVWCDPLAGSCADPSRWRSEMRVTESSLDIARAPVARGLFLGDYMGLASAGGDFISVFTQPHDTDPSSVFARRLVLPARIEPKPAGFWKRQVGIALTGRGTPQESGAALLEDLAKVRDLSDVFDAVADLPGLAEVLTPPGPPEPRGGCAQQLMALLLNLASTRLSPQAALRDGRSVAEAAASIEAVLADPAAARRSLAEAKSLAASINTRRAKLH